MYLEISNPMDYHVALYIRLSKEDESEGPSQSVTNQRSMLEEFVEQHRLSVYDVYTDDGWSGTNFDRPDFQRMIADIEAKKVNMVITKDLSRLGRDYIMTGHYMERYFPEHRVRYISLLDRCGLLRQRHHALPGHYERYVRQGYLQEDQECQAR